MVKLTGKAKAKFLARMKKGRKAAKGKKKRGGGKKKKDWSKAATSQSLGGGRVHIKKRLAAIELELANLRERHGTDKSLKGDLLRSEKSELDAGDW